MRRNLWKKIKLNETANETGKKFIKETRNEFKKESEMQLDGTKPMKGIVKNGRK